jgi:hypothetical protein
LAAWSPCLWPAAVRGKELAVALHTTPNSTSSNAWPARPCQARPRHIPGSIGLRALYCTPSGARVRARLRPLNMSPASGSVYVIENGFKLAIGPTNHLLFRWDDILAAFSNELSQIFPARGFFQTFWKRMFVAPARLSPFVPQGLDGESTRTQGDASRRIGREPIGGAVEDTSISRGVGRLGPQRWADEKSVSPSLRIHPDSVARDVLVLAE